MEAVMTIPRHFGLGLLATTATCAILVLRTGASAETPQPPAPAQSAVPRDGQHDFDFGAGTWHTHITRTPDPFSKPNDTITIEGTVSSRKVWGGRAWLEEIQADGPKGHWEAMNLFLYNPQTRQWSMNYLNSQAGILGQPSIGSFNDAGLGRFVSGDTFNDRAILVRAVWTRINANAHTYEEDYSDDGGKTWKTAFLAHKTRIAPGEVKPVPVVPNDFDFDIGTFRLHSTRLLNPLTGSTKWTDTEGTSVVSRFWGGRGNLAEVHIDPPFGPIDFLALRWYSPNAHQWFLDFANAANGALGVPLAGVFHNGRLDLYDAETMEGKQTLVHFAIWPTTKDAGASEQAFSADGGQTWEVNYKTHYTRIFR
jgi:hypothetical protein